MLNSTIKIFYFTLIFIFFYFVFSTYFSKKNTSNVTSKILNIEKKSEIEFNDLPIIKNDTNNIITYNLEEVIENKVKKLPSIETLKMRSDFVRIAAKKRYWATPGLILQVSESPRETYDKSVIRIGYTASKKVGNAVKRNRARRRLRETVKKLMPFQVESGNDFVVIARAKTLNRVSQDGHDGKRDGSDGDRSDSVSIHRGSSLNRHDSKSTVKTQSGNGKAIRKGAHQRDLPPDPDFKRQEGPDKTHFFREKLQPRRTVRRHTDV